MGVFPLAPTPVSVRDKVRAMVRVMVVIRVRVRVGVVSRVSTIS